MCEVIIIDLFSSSAIYSRSMSSTSLRAWTSSPAVGSSKINSSALCVIEISIFNLTFIPDENSAIFLFIGNLYSRHFLSKKSLLNLGYILARICSISFTLSCEQNPESSNNTPILFLSSAESFPASTPNVLTHPLSGLTSPNIRLIAVLFPAPFLPRYILSFFYYYPLAQYRHYNYNLIWEYLYLL